MRQWNAVNLYHETGIVDDLIGGLQDIGGMNKIMVWIAIFAVATFHLLEKILQSGDRNLNKRIESFCCIPKSNKLYTKFIREIVALHKLETHVT